MHSAPDLARVVLIGVAAARTPTPWKNRLRSTANHAVFGVGLFLDAALVAAVSG